MSLTIAEAVADWNKSDISDAALQMLINETRRAIQLHQAFGERGLVVNGLYSRLMSFENVKDCRKRYGRITQPQRVLDPVRKPPPEIRE
jgi:hypothetical protein